MSLCRFKNILGKPNEGIHHYRLFNIAIFDLLLTILLALLFAIILHKLFNLKIRFIYLSSIILVIFLLIGIFLHRIFCVQTTIDKLLF